LPVGPTLPVAFRVSRTRWASSTTRP
jgi:hypothetical protein